MDFLLPLVLLKVGAAGFTLRLAADTAVQLIAMSWYPKAHALVAVVGLDGLSSLLGCCGLSVAFLSVAGGLLMGSMMENQPYSCVGLAACLGCGLAGALLSWTAMGVMALGLRGLCVTGSMLGLSLMLVDKQQPTAAYPKRLLIFLAVTFVTMYLGVFSGQVVHPSKLGILVVILILLPTGLLLGSLADRTAFRRPGGYMTQSFVVLVLLTGILLGLGIENDSKEHSFFSETYYTVQSVVYLLELLIGLIGGVSGLTAVCFWEAERTEALSLCISVPAVVILHVVDVQHETLPSLDEWCFGAGGLFGLISGLAAASGVSLGLVFMSSGEQLWSCTAIVIGVTLVGIHNDLFSFSDALIPLALPFVQKLLSSSEIPLEQGGGSGLVEAAGRSAVLGVVMMGALVLGAAGLLTAALGPQALSLVISAILITVMLAIRVSQGH